MPQSRATARRPLALFGPSHQTQVEWEAQLSFLGSSRAQQQSHDDPGTQHPMDLSGCGFSPPKREHLSGGQRTCGNPLGVATVCLQGPALETPIWHPETEDILPKMIKKTSKLGRPSSVYPPVERGMASWSVPIHYPFWATKCDKDLAGFSKRVEKLPLTSIAMVLKWQWY